MNCLESLLHFKSLNDDKFSDALIFVGRDLDSFLQEHIIRSFQERQQLSKTFICKLVFPFLNEDEIEVIYILFFFIIFLFYKLHKNSLIQEIM